MAFFVVYIQEAHPTDLWQMGSNIRENVVYRSPRSDDERNQVASSCVRNLGIRIPAVRDGVANGIERAYTGWPDRLYLIDRGGRVVFKSPPGPFGFDSTALGRALAGLSL